MVVLSLLKHLLIFMEIFYSSRDADEFYSTQVIKKSI